MHEHSTGGADARLTSLLRAALLGLLAAPGLAGATGWFINQQSVPAIGRAGAGTVVDAHDPAAAYFNPAALVSPGISYATGTELSLGMQVIAPRTSLRDLGSTANGPATPGTVPYPGTGFDNPTDPTPVPNLFLVHRLPDGRTALALGLTSPFGLSLDYSPQWFGRYDSTRVSLETVNVTLSAARRVGDTLSVGGGVDWQHARSDLQAALPDPLNPGGPTPATDGRTHLRGVGSGVGFHLGTSWAPTAGLRIGAHYRSGVDISLGGTNTVQGLTGPLAGANGSLVATSRMRMPAMAGVGVAWDAARRLTLLAQVDGYGWSRFGDLRVRFADGSPDAVRQSGYRDAIAVSVGAEWRRSEQLTLRAGLRREQTPTTDGFRDTTFPDGARTWLTAGASMRVSGRSSIDLALKHAMFSDGPIDLNPTFYAGTPLATSIRVRGIASSQSVTTVGAAWRMRF